KVSGGAAAAHAYSASQWTPALLHPLVTISIVTVRARNFTVERSVLSEFVPRRTSSIHQRTLVTLPFSQKQPGPRNVEDRRAARQQLRSQSRPARHRP